jgi:hypothetical protein
MPSKGKDADKPQFHPDGRPVEYGPDGKMIPPKPLTETEQVQLQIENQICNVMIHKTTKSHLYFICFRCF